MQTRPLRPAHVLTALVLAFNLAYVPPALAADPTPPAPSKASAPLAISIDNFGKVDANYYRGAQPQGRNFAALASLGVKMVIDLAREGDPAEAANAEHAGMKFVRIPLTTSEAPSAAAIAQFLKLVSDPANQPVYVHCMRLRALLGAQPQPQR